MHFEKLYSAVLISGFPSACVYAYFEMSYEKRLMEMTHLEKNKTKNKFIRSLKVVLEV